MMICVIGDVCGTLLTDSERERYERRRRKAMGLGREKGGVVGTLGMDGWLVDPVCTS